MLTSDTVERPRSQALYAGWRTAGDLGGSGTVYGQRRRKSTGARRRIGSSLTRTLRRHVPFRRFAARLGVRWRELSVYVRGLLIAGLVVWSYIFVIIGPYLQKEVFPR